MLFALLKGVGPGSPPVENQSQANGLEQLGSDIDADDVKRSLFTEDLSDELQTYQVSLEESLLATVQRKTYARSRCRRKDQSAQIRRALVAQGARGIEQCAHTIALQGRAHERRAPGEGCTAGLARADKLLLGVGGLCAVVGLAEDGSEDNEVDAVVEEGAEGDGRGLDRREVWMVFFRRRF